MSQRDLKSVALAGDAGQALARASDARAAGGVEASMTQKPRVPGRSRIRPLDAGTVEGAPKDPAEAQADVNRATKGQSVALAGIAGGLGVIAGPCER